MEIPRSELSRESGDSGSLDNQDPAWGQAQQDRIIHLVAEQVKQRGYDYPVTITARLDKDLGFDSLGLIILASHVEEEFGIEFTRDLIAEVRTVQQLIAATQDALTSRS